MSSSVSPTPLPLAYLLRPKSLDEVVGHKSLLGEAGDKAPSPTTGLLRKFIDNKSLPSLIFWGTPGSGKTSLAQVLANSLDLEFVAISAVFAGMSELKKIFKKAEENLNHRRTLLFIDEIHRFNKLQQDGLLESTERGLITLIGATTENPSFSINSALLSRVQVIVLNSLKEEDLNILYERAQKHYLAQNREIVFSSESLKKLFQLADGDGRRLLNLIEKVYLLIYPADKPKELNPIDLSLSKFNKIIESTPSFLRYDKADEHYNLISALHKSIRGSDCDASLYWLNRMLSGGEDPHYLSRRLLRIAYEDVGLADPQAAAYILTAWQTYERLGSPEGEIALAGAVVYLALAPKSNRLYTATKQAAQVAKQGSFPPPKHILNAPTKLMKNLGYGQGYQYDPDTESGVSGQNYFPEELTEPKEFYHPAPRGFEREMKKRLHYYKQLRKNRPSQ